MGDSTGYKTGPIAFPYDDLDGWRHPYPPDVFIGQFEKMAAGFEQALAKLKNAVANSITKLAAPEREALIQELNVDEAATIHFRSTANQARFTWTRDKLRASSKADAQPLLETLDRLLRDEMELARRLYAIQMRDSRIGFEASNQYYYVPIDLAEKVLNCSDLLTRWLPKL